MPGIDDIINEEKPLPLFRKDLELYKGPDNRDGSPTYNVLDPIKNRYYKISWEEALIIQYAEPGMKMADLVHVIQSNSSLRLTVEDLRSFYIDALRYNLLSMMHTSEMMHREAKMHKHGWFQWLLFHYLYIRIPLINPDRFLRKTVHHTKFFFSKAAFIFYLFASLFGMFLLITRFDDYLHTFTYFFNVEGALAYSIAIICVKLIHEFSHAYVAKRMGIHVPTMGVALIVLWPVLYTDVTDSWKLSSRRKRIAISIAGIVAELIVAGLCTIGWAWSEPGLLQSVFFVISSVTWISTLVINLNPAVRFDGYYILCDLCHIDNLQPRAFQYTRWILRKVFLGIDLPTPEETLSKKSKIWLIAYTFYTWIYRLFLYIGIAVFVYYQFTKALGIFLFLIEVGVFILWPIFSEFYELRKMRSHFKLNFRVVATFSVFMAIFLWFALPLPRKETFVAITAPISEQLIYMPDNAMIEDIHVKRGSHVNKNDVILQLISPDLNEKIIAKEAEEKVAKEELQNYIQSEEQRPYITEKKAEVSSLQEELESLLAKRESLLIRAEQAGTVFDWSEVPKKNVYLEKDLVLGKIADLTSIKVICYVPEALEDTVYVGQKAKFILSSTRQKYEGKITHIEPTRTTYLRYPQLASINSGDLPVAASYTERSARGAEKPSNKYRGGEHSLIDSYYEVTVTFNESDEKEKQKIDQLRFGMKGEVQVHGPWRSKLWELIQYIISIFWRESGL